MLHSIPRLFNNWSHMRRAREGACKLKSEVCTSRSQLTSPCSCYLDVRLYNQTAWHTKPRSGAMLPRCSAVRRARRLIRLTAASGSGGSGRSRAHSSPAAAAANGARRSCLTRMAASASSSSVVNQDKVGERGQWTSGLHLH